MARVEAQLLRARIRAVEEANARRLDLDLRAGAGRHRDPAWTGSRVRADEPCVRTARRIGRDVIGKPHARRRFPKSTRRASSNCLIDVYLSGRPYSAVASFTLLSIARCRRDLEAAVLRFRLPAAGRRHRSRSKESPRWCYDVTELTRARQDAEVANRAKDEFLAMLGHELRNPLAPILTALQLLRLRGVQAGEREREIIERQVKHLVRLVDDLLDVSRITRGKIELSERRLRSVKSRKGGRNRQPAVRTEAPRAAGDVPRGRSCRRRRRGRLAQVIANLLTNAAKYTEDGGRITVSAAADGDQAVLRVRDTGIGSHRRCCREFSISSCRSVRPLIARRAASAWGWRLSAASWNCTAAWLKPPAMGSGTAPSSSCGFPEYRRLMSRSLGQSDAPEAVHLTERARRVLVVDDNEDAAAMLAEALAVYGHTVRTAHDAFAALRVAETFAPDIALVDIGLPVMDGYELAQRFAEHPHLRGTRLVAVTGYGQEQDHARTAAAGFVGHMVKPVDLDQVRTLVESLPASLPRD